jgi:hypothetical protein
LLAFTELLHGTCKEHGVSFVVIVELVVVMVDGAQRNPFIVEEDDEGVW